MTPSSSPKAPGASTGGIIQRMRRHPVFFYFLMAFGFTWVFNHTRGSLLLMMLLAASLNTGGLFVTLSFPSLSQTLVFNTPALNLILDLVPLAPALLLIALTRGQLGYHHYRHEAEALDLPSNMQEQVA